MASDYITVRREIESCIDNADSRKILVLVFMLAMGNVADAIQITSISYVMSEIVNVTTFDKIWLSSSIFIGMLLGSVIFGYMSDREGRRPSILLALMMNFVGGLAAVCAKDGSAGIEYLVVCYVFAGIGIGGTVPISFTLGVELFPTDNRGQYLAAMGSCWMIGNLYTAAVGWVLLGNDISGNKIMSEEIGNWRVFVVACAVPILATFVLTYVYVPESPLFLLVRGRYSEVAAFNLKHSALYGAAPVGEGADGTDGGVATENPIRPMEVSSEVDLNALAPDGQRSLSASAARYSSIEMTRVADVEVTRRVSRVATGSRQTSQSTHGQYYRHVALLCIVRFCLSFGTFGILLWVNTLFQSMRLVNIYAATFLFALGSLPGSAFAYMYVERFGRKTILCGSLLASVVAGCAFAGSASLQLRVLEAGAATDGQMFVNAMIVVSSMLFGAFTVSGWNALDILSVELFPASVRPTTMGGLSAVGRVGAIASQVACGYMVFEQGRIVELLLTVDLCMVIAFLCSLCLPDTTGIYLGGHAELEQVGEGAESDARLDSLDDTAEVRGPEDEEEAAADPVSAISRSIRNMPAVLAANMDLPLFVSPRSRDHSPMTATGQHSGLGTVSFGSRRSDVSSASFAI